MKFLFVLGLSVSAMASAQELEYGDVYRPQEIIAIMNTSHSVFKDPNCIKDYLKTPDYLDRVKQGDHIRYVNICSQGKNLRFNIRFNQMGGRIGSVPSVNSIVDCDLKKSVAPVGCNWDI